MIFIDFNVFLPMLVDSPSIDQAGGCRESRNSKSAFGDDGLRNAKKITCYGIRDFESTHLTKNIFFGFLTWGNGFPAPRRFSQISEISEIWSPAGELWRDLRPAGKRPGRILIDFRWIFFSPGSKSHGFSLAGDENLLIFLNFMFFADLLRIYKGGPFFRQI